MKDHPRMGVWTRRVALADSLAIGLGVRQCCAGSIRSLVRRCCPVPGTNDHLTCPVDWVTPHDVRHWWHCQLLVDFLLVCLCEVCELSCASPVGKSNTMKCDTSKCTFKSSGGFDRGWRRGGRSDG